MHLNLDYWFKTGPGIYHPADTLSSSVSGVTVLSKQLQHLLYLSLREVTSCSPRLVHSTSLREARFRWFPGDFRCVYAMTQGAISLAKDEGTTHPTHTHTFTNLICGECPSRMVSISHIFLILNTKYGPWHLSHWVTLMDRRNNIHKKCIAHVLAHERSLVNISAPSFWSS